MKRAALILTLLAAASYAGDFLSLRLQIPNRAQTEQVYENLLTAKRASGVAILLVEQNVEQALPLADQLYLLNLGQVKAEGPGREFDNARVRTLIQECLLG